MKFGQGRLKGIEVHIYQGADGHWNSSVLLDKSVWGRGTGYDEPTHLPRIGNRPLTDSGSGRWWYDLSAGRHVYTAKHHENSWHGKGSKPRNNAERLESIRFQTAELVMRLVPGADPGKVLVAVNKIDAPACHNYKGGAE